jgi:hypothetical protein
MSLHPDEYALLDQGAEEEKGLNPDGDKTDPLYILSGSGPFFTLPPPRTDSFLESLGQLVFTELYDKLKNAKRFAPDEVGAIESEMIRRGMDLPKEEPRPQPVPEPEPGQEKKEKIEEAPKKRTRKKKEM